MSQGPIPFRTYVIAGTLSVVVNIAAVGTFATARVGSVSFSTQVRSGTDASATVVLTDWPEAREVPTEPEPAPLEPPAKNESQAAPPPPPPPPKPEEPRVRLGNADAPESDSKVWLGVSKDAGTLKVRPGVFEQAEFKKGAPGQPIAQDDTATTPRPPSTIPMRENQPSPAKEQAQDAPTSLNPTVDTGARTEDRARDAARPAADDTLTSEDVINATPGDRTERGTPSTADPFLVTLDTARQATTRLTRQVVEALERASQPKTQDAEAKDGTDAANRRLLDVSTPTDAPAIATPVAPTPPAPKPQATHDRSGQNGNGADRESDAFSRDRPVNIRLGQPLAGKGLSIKTVAPRWTTATRVLHRFRDPVVRVKFGRNGKVIKAAFVPGKDAGHPDVSGPLLDAIYRWTAQGEELNQIPENDPLAGLVLEFNVILN